MSSKDKYSFIENGSFIVFDDGRIFKKLEPPVSSGGYMFIRIGEKSFPLHRVIASAFIPNPENKPEVNHIDGDKTNNAVSNLEWTTRKENARHAAEHGLLKRKKQRRSVPQRKHRNPSLIEGTSKIRLYRMKAGLSQTELSHSIGINQAAISQWESGKTQPTIENLKLIAEALKCKPGDLL